MVTVLIGHRPTGNPPGLLPPPPLQEEEAPPRPTATTHCPHDLLPATSFLVPEPSAATN